MANPKQIRTLAVNLPAQYDASTIQHILETMLLDIDQLKFDAKKGHKHSGVAGDAPKIPSANVV